MRIRRLPYLCAVLLLAPGLATAAKLFEAHSKAPGAKMDISLREIERRPRSSVLAIEVRDPGSSVGGAFFILCSIGKIANDFRHLVIGRPQIGQFFGIAIGKVCGCGHKKLRCATVEYRFVD